MSTDSTTFLCLMYKLVFINNLLYRNSILLVRKKNFFIQWFKTDTVIYKLAMMNRNKKCFYRD